MTDHELLARYRAGDQSAFTDFYQRHEHRIRRRIAARHQLADCDIDIVVQTAFLQLSQSTATPTEPVKLLSTIANRRAIDLVREQSRTRERFQPLTDQDEFFAPSGELAATLDEAVKQLPPDEHEVISCLRQEWTLTRTSVHLGVTRQTVANRRNRAYAKLQELLA